MTLPPFLHRWRPHALSGLLTWASLEVLYVVIAATRQGARFPGSLVTGAMWAIVVGVQLLPALIVLRARSTAPAVRGVFALVVLGWGVLMLLGGSQFSFSPPAPDPTKERNFDLRWLELLMLVGGFMRLILAVLVSMPRPPDPSARRAPRMR
ncbi:hypothetical protein [Melittangium boletus]|uniref:hypothetical protein n=1 Tax=Melittangium boletus TaxID=83453 RepID=UPI003DA1EF7B